ncbi:hypothetical protein Tco_1146890 [Tanacetum coccineum]
MANDDPILTTMRFIPQHEVVQKYGEILPDYLTNLAMKASEAYKTYHDSYWKGATKQIMRSLEVKQMKTIMMIMKMMMMIQGVPDVDIDSERTSIRHVGDDFVIPKFTSHDTEERHDEEDKDKESFDLRVQTPSHYEPSDDEANDDLAQSGYAEEEEVNVEQTFEANIN